MAYDKFTTVQLKTRFGLEVTERVGLFAEVPPSPVSDLLQQTLAQNSGLALRGNSEKARSEYLIAPILAEVYQQTRDYANLFSGTEFTVDRKNGLTGFCDFLFSLSPLTIEIEAPIISVVEAKKEDLLKGIPQCLAELIAAQVFNARAKKPIETLYGAVTTGTDWKFLRLQDTLATIDGDLYYLSQPEKIVGIILSMLRSTP